MSTTTGPTLRQPAANESQYAYLVGAATYVLSEGAATLMGVQTGVAGGSGASAEIYDARTGDSLSDANKVAEVLLTSATAIRWTGDGGLALGRGLTVVLNSGATVECTVAYRGLASTSARTFGA